MSLPLTPFVHVPHNRWVDGASKHVKAERIDVTKLKIDSDEEYDSDSTSSSYSTEVYDSSDADTEASYESISTQDSEDQEIIDIEKLMRDAQDGARERLQNVVNSSVERMKGRERVKPFTIVYKFFRKYYDRWYERNKEARMHPTLKRYQRRVLEYEAKLKKEFEEEQEKHSREIVKEAKRLQRRREINAMVKDRGEKILAKFAADVAVRDREAEHMHFLCVNMQRWAGDNYDRDQRLAHQAELDNIVAEKKAHDQAIADEIKADKGVIEEDIRNTQEVYRQMRQQGLKEGVNVQPKAAKKEKRAKKVDRQARNVTIKLREDAALAFKSWQPKHEQAKMQRESMVFNVNLMNLKFVKKLKGTRIGEKGALALAADLVRGACPQLNTLDLSYCEIQTRGFMRILHGIRIANLSGLTTLRMAGNELTPRALELLRTMLNLTIFENLSVFDFRHNELGDLGAELIGSMALFDQLENITELRLDNNMITDEGFKALVTIFSAIRDDKCPNLQILSIGQNKISPQIKATLDPLPYFIQC